MDTVMSWADAVFNALFGSLIIWAAIALGFLTADLLGIL